MADRARRISARIEIARVFRPQCFVGRGRDETILHATKPFFACGADIRKQRLAIKPANKTALPAADPETDRCGPSASSSLLLLCSRAPRWPGHPTICRLRVLLPITARPPRIPHPSSLQPSKPAPRQSRKKSERPTCSFVSAAQRLRFPSSSVGQAQAQVQAQIGSNPFTAETSRSPRRVRAPVCAAHDGPLGPSGIGLRLPA